MRRAGVFVVVLALVGCQDASIEWEYRIDPGVSAPVWIGSTIGPGACGSDEMLLGMSDFFARGEAAPNPPSVLEGGAWCFTVVAYDVSCVPVGRGNEAVELPLDGDTVRVNVTAITETAADPSCESGAALRRDGGV